MAWFDAGLGSSGGGGGPNGVGNDTTNNVYADLTVGSSRINVLDLVLTIRYTK